LYTPLSVKEAYKLVPGPQSGDHSLANIAALVNI